MLIQCEKDYMVLNDATKMQFLSQLETDMVLKF